MGLFKKRKSRATRRAEARAIKARAKLEARLRVRNYARINLILSLPVSVAMVAPAHLL